METLFVRSTFFGSPFCHTNSGRDGRDRLNQQRLRQAMQNYKQSEEAAGLQHRYSDTQVNVARIVLPLAGALFGKFLADIYCAPSSIYLKGIFTVGLAVYFNKVAMDINNHNQVSFWTNNFPSLPSDLQQALKSHDARYCTKWLE